MLSPWHRILESAGDAHLVQFYGSDHESLVSNVSRYFADGLAAGEPGLIIATDAHNGMFQKALRLEPGQQVLYLEASETLAKFMIAGQPDWNRFYSVIGEALHTLRQPTNAVSIRAYGEMVGMLWTAGQFAAAVRLEQFWNRLLSRSRANLYCGYPIDVLSSGFHPRNIDALLCNHTHVIPGIDGGFESFVLGAIEDVLPGEYAAVRAALARRNSAWALLPRGEAAILALRNRAPHEADEILSIAKTRYAAVAKLDSAPTRS